MASDDHAVLVGVTRYPHLGDLKGPENDVHAVKEWLEDPVGGNVPTDNITLVTSSQYPTGDPPEPTPERVLSKFAPFNARGEASAPKPFGRRLYIFLAGHGSALPGDLFEAVLLMANANAKSKEMSHYVPGRMIASHFGTAAYFRQIVVFMDCCRDALPGVQRRGLPWDVVSNPTDEDVEYCLGFATRWSRKARERNFGEEGSRGIFTRSVLEGLRAGFDTPRKLEDFVLQRLPVIAGKNGVRKPEFSFSDESMRLSESEEVELPKLRITCSAPSNDMTATLLNGNLVELASWPQDEVWERPLQPGLYLVRRADRADPVNVNLTGDLDVEI